MANKDKQTYAMVAGVIIIGLVVWYVNTRSVEPENALPEQNTQNTAEEIKNENEVMDSMELPGTWSGILKNSDNLAKGNLVLVTNNHIIYLRTSRDFSSLLDSEVNVKYEGTLEKFILKDIIEKK